MATRRVVRHTRSYHSAAWMFELSFWLVVLIGAAMALVGIMHVIGVTAFDKAAWWVKHVCMIIAMIIPVVMSWEVAKYKSTVWKVLWVIFVILIVVGVILAGL